MKTTILVLTLAVLATSALAAPKGSDLFNLSCSEKKLIKTPDGEIESQDLSLEYDYAESSNSDRSRIREVRYGGYDNGSADITRTIISPSLLQDVVDDSGDLGDGTYWNARSILTWKVLSKTDEKEVMELESMTVEGKPNDKHMIRVMTKTATGHNLDVFFTETKDRDGNEVLSHQRHCKITKK